MLRIRSDWRDGSIGGGGISWELPLGMLQTATLLFPTKQQKQITAREDGAIPPFGADPKDPLQIRSIRITPPS
jgi:hypothetical protein